MEQKEKKICLCMPEFSVLALLFSPISYKNISTVVYYDYLPRYLRGIKLFFKVPENKIISLISRVTRFSILKIKHGDYLSDYPYINIQAMEKVTAVAAGLIPEIGSVPQREWLKNLVGENASFAYSLKYISNYRLFPSILSVSVCCKSLSSVDNCIVVDSPELPNSCKESIIRNLKELNFTFFKWPIWFVCIKGIFIRLLLFLKAPLITLLYLSKRGLRLTSPLKKEFKIITEFIEPARLNGTAYDADYWVDGKEIKKEEVLFFFTDRQKNILLKDGYSFHDIIKLFKEKGYNLAVISNLPYFFSSLKYFLVLYLRLIRELFRFNYSYFYHILFQAWSEYLEYLPLFLHFSGKNFIYLTFPNGHTGFRSDDAIITGLCRKYGIRSVGCQTRAIYAAKFEDCFDCFDLYLSWGEAWDGPMKERSSFVRKTTVVGCIYLDRLLPLYKDYIQRTAGGIKEKKIMVAIFNSDISDNHHYTMNYTKSFLIKCMKLSAVFDCKFVIKTKDPQHIKRLMLEDDFFEVYTAFKEKVNFNEQLRHDYVDVLCACDIIIAIGFTTPSIEGLLLGKRALYYSELKCSVPAFSRLPFFVANNEEELKSIFARALNDYTEYSGLSAEGINRLDPFRDGCALGRIQEALLN